MAGESAEQLIINRLAQAPSFHPSGAKLFVPDWTLDPGDVVTVQSDGEDYAVPIYSLDLSWNGACRADIQSTGNQKREPLSALRRKEFSSGRRGYGRQQELENEFKEFETWQTQTDETIGTYAAQFVEILGEDGNPGRLTLAETAIEQTASDATITAQAAGILLDQDGHPILDERGKYQYDPNAENTTLTARIKTNATSITTEVSRAEGEESRLSGLIMTEAGKITQIVSAVGSNGQVTAGSIILAINKTKDGSATSTTTITADAINLEGYVTASYVDATILKVDSLTSSSGYSGSIAVSTSVTAGTVIADNYYFKDPLATANEQMHTRPIQLLGGDKVYLSNISAVAIGTAGTMDIRHYHDIDIEEVTSGANEGKMKVTIGHAVATTDTSNHISFFKIADTAKYKADVGISTVEPSGWTNDGEGGGYYNIVTATAKDSTQQKPDTMDVNVALPTITVRPDLGTNASGTVKAYGPVVDGTDYQVSTAATLYLKADDDYCYITSNDNTPTAANIVAQIENPGGGSAGDYDIGYADGQDNASAVMSGVALNRTNTKYENNQLSLQIIATPKLVLLSKDGSETTERTGTRDVVDDSMPVAITSATLSEGTFTNGQYTITGSGGNVNIDAVDGMGGTNIPVGVTPLTFTPTEALNSVNVVKGNWTGTTTKTIEFTTDAPSPNANAPKSVTLSWNNGGWVWTAADDSGNYQKQIQVKDGSTGVLTDYVELPDFSVIVDTPQQQESWWKTSGTNAYKYVVPVVGATGYLASDTSHQHLLGLWTNNNIVINPAKAIEYGQSLVSVSAELKSEATPTGKTAETLASGTYTLKSIKDDTKADVAYYQVPAVSSASITNLSGEGIGDALVPTFAITASGINVANYSENATLARGTYASGSNNLHCVTLSMDATVIGRISTESVYTDGFGVCYDSIGLSAASQTLEPGGAALTIYPTAKSSVYQSSATNITAKGITITPRALKLKDETFSANDTYTVPAGYDGYGTITVDVQGGGGGNYYATFLDKITLTSDDIGSSVTKYSTANYSDGHKDSAANTRVEIDASAVYSAGVTAGLGGVVDVIKQPWNGNTCEFTPSAGEGASASVTITAEPTKVSLANATSTGEVVLKDGDNSIQTKNYYLRSRTYNGQNYVVLTDNSSMISLGTVLAKYSASGGSGETRAVESISPITLTPFDTGSDITKYPTLYYDDQTDDNSIPLYIDASAVYRKGQQDGAGLSILEQYNTTINSNNTTVTLLPSDKGDYNVMAGARVTVSVPVHEGVQGATLLASTDSDTTWEGWQLNDKTELSRKYGFIRITGKDGSTYSYGVDATDVFDAGVSAGADIKIENSKAYGSTVTETGTYTINPSSGYGAMKKATFSVRVPTVPRIQSTLAYGTASMGSHTVYPDEDYDAMQKVTFTVPTVTVDTERNQPTSGVTTTNIKAGNNIKVIVKFGNAIVHQQIFVATT